MTRRMILPFIFFALASIVLEGCTKKAHEPPGQQQSLMTGSATNSVAGVRWTIPQRWAEQGPRQMRVATYSVPAAKGDDEGGECAVFYFGSDQGGNVDANIERWAGQFENSPTPEKSTKQVNGMTVTTVQVSGDFLSPGGPMMQSQGKKENYKLSGAIVEAPEGMVFFKFTGPRATVEAARSEFDALISSITK
jgi:FlaG/FlaF family flagellin (archaellin)